MADLTGKTIANRYRVDSLIGHGGMGDVYKVWDRRRAVFLAMKVLHSDLAEDKIFLRRFAREAETLSALQHPHIVRFYGLEQDGDLTFMLMDYVEGTTLRKLIFDARQPFSAERVLQIMRPVCSALHYAHDMGRVHCDIKPANIMVKTNGEVLVADFGIARMMESSTTTTMVGAGTPAYMAPEQALGKKPQPQTDIYALGIVLYEMLTGGERPFTGEQAKIEGSTSDKVRWEQVESRPPSPRKYNPAISIAMETVIMKCLRKDPAQRYASALEFLQAAELAIGGVEEARAFVKQPLQMEQPAAKPVPVVEKKEEKQKKPAPLSPLPIPELVEGLGERRVRAKLTSNSIFLWLGIGGIVVLVLILATYGLTHLPATPKLSPTAQTTSTFELPTATLELPTGTSTATLVPTPAFGIGSTMVSEKDGMTLLYVPAGNFLMGSTNSDPNAQANEEPQRTVYLDAFWIDQTDVTNAMYAKCVSASKCEQPTNLSSQTRSSHSGNSQFDDYPVINVNWNMADAYCKWAGRQLPTEAQWEKAARGADGSTYPWGNEAPDSTLLNYYISNIGDTTEVGRYPKGASPYGALDMAGNVWQWVADWYAPYPGNTVSDSSYGTTYRVLRGGSWYSNDSDVRSANRYRFDPVPIYSNIGFRCARPATSPVALSSTNLPIPASTPSSAALGIGSTMISDKDGMTLLYVPAGPFTMGNDNGQPDEKPAHMVYLDAFWIDQTDVTNKMYALCVSAGACTSPSQTGSFRHSSYYGNSEFDDYPKIYVSWNDATAFCKWADRRLPSEAEWEKVARGTDGRIYPWGNDAPNDTLLNYNQNVGDTTAVGTYPKGASPYGALDMAGNVWEWVNDLYSSTYYQSSPSSNPPGPASGQYRVLRGGAWGNNHDWIWHYMAEYYSNYYVLSAARYYEGLLPAEAVSFAGFRCARSQ